MKFCVSVVAACLLSIISPCLAYAQPNNPPEITANASSDGTMITITGSVTDEDLSTVDVSVSAGAAPNGKIYLNPDSTFSIKIDVPPFIAEVHVKAMDAKGKIDSCIVYL